MLLFSQGWPIAKLNKILGVSPLLMPADCEITRHLTDRDNHLNTCAVKLS